MNAIRRFNPRPASGAKELHPSFRLHPERFNPRPASGAKEGKFDVELTHSSVSIRAPRAGRKFAGQWLGSGLAEFQSAPRERGESLRAFSDCLEDIGFQSASRERGES